jgi:hypothetical protein
MPSLRIWIDWLQTETDSSNSTVRPHALIASSKASDTGGYQLADPRQGGGSNRFFHFAPNNFLKGADWYTARTIVCRDDDANMTPKCCPSKDASSDRTQIENIRSCSEGREKPKAAGANSRVDVTRFKFLDSGDKR